MDERDAQPDGHAEIQRHPNHFGFPGVPTVGHDPVRGDIEESLRHGHVVPANGFVGNPARPVHGDVDQVHVSHVDHAGHAPADQERPAVGQATRINGRDAGHQ